jgi:hypothetical protein
LFLGREREPFGDVLNDGAGETEDLLEDPGAMSW